MTKGKATPLSKRQGVEDIGLASVLDDPTRRFSPARYPDFETGKVLRQGWLHVPIEMVVQLRREKADPALEGNLPFVGMDDIETDGLKVVQTRPFAEMKSLGNRFRPGDMLYGRLRPYLNKTAIVNQEGACSGELLVLTPSPAIDVRYLQYFMHSRRYVGWVSAAVSGDRPRVGFETLAGFAIPLPPIAEQRRIVARIDALFAEIDEGEAALAEARKELDIFRRGLLKAAVTGELSKNWRETNLVVETGQSTLERLRERYPDTSPTRAGWKPKGNLRPLPDGWTWCAVEEAGEVQLGRQRAPQHHHGENMRPYLRVANVLEDRLDLSDVKWMNFTAAEFQIFALRSGDILLNEGQAPDLLGRPAMYRDEIPECCFQKTLLRFRAKEGILPDYAMIVFRYYMHSGRFRRESRITTNIGHLTQIRFVVMEFPLPPVAEQQAIVDLFREKETAVSDVLTFLDAEAGDAARLKQSILKAAFEGRLVPQDPADEPAHEMLARLAANPDVSRARRGKESERRG